MLTKNEASEISGVPAPTLQRWIEEGISKPALLGCSSPGRSHRFTLTQVVGLTVAEALRCSEVGYSRPGIRRVFEAFGAVDQEWLEEQFEEGNTHFVAVQQSRPLLQGQRA